MKQKKPFVSNTMNILSRIYSDVFDGSNSWRRASHQIENELQFELLLVLPGDYPESNMKVARDVKKITKSYWFRYDVRVIRSGDVTNINWFVVTNYPIVFDQHYREDLYRIGNDIMEKYAKQ